MPVNDRPPGVLDHFAPVVGLLAAAAVAEEDPTDGTGGADTIVVADDQLQVDTLTAVDKCLEDPYSVKYIHILGCSDFNNPITLTLG
jgi:hypothetical protein